MYRFIKMILFNNRPEQTEEEQSTRDQLFTIMESKIRSLLKALFNFDKLKW